MVGNANERRRAEEEPAHLEQWLERLQCDHPAPAKGLAKAGVRKVIARPHEELALYGGRQEARLAGN